MPHVRFLTACFAALAFLASRVRPSTPPLFQKVERHFLDGQRGGFSTSGIHRCPQTSHMATRISFQAISNSIIAQRWLDNIVTDAHNADVFCTTFIMYDGSFVPEFTEELVADEGYRLATVARAPGHVGSQSFADITRHERGFGGPAPSPFSEYAPAP